MAVTGFWPIYKNLKATLDYADNPDKTTAREYLDDDLYAALSYAENDNKTDRKMYVGGTSPARKRIGTISVRMWNIACLLLPLRENLIAGYMRSDIRLTTYVFP